MSDTVFAIDANIFIGNTKKRTQDLCEAMNLIFRLCSVDGEPYLGYPQDTRDDRVCVEIEKGVVVKATIQ